MTPLARIQEYYRRVDANDIDWVVDLFADDAVYARANSRFEGKETIAGFFRSDRKIRGTHGIESTCAIDDLVFAKGEFVGVGDAGDDRRVRFFDVWQFEPGGKVTLRETYLALGHEYVRD